MRLFVSVLLCVLALVARSAPIGFRQNVWEVGVPPVLFSESWSNLAKWDIHGAPSATVSTNHLHVSGRGTANASDYISTGNQAYQTGVENWQLNTTVSTSATNVSGWGVGIGRAGFPASYQGVLNADGTSTNFGKIKITVWNSAQTAAPVDCIISGTRLSFNTNDVLNFTMTRTNIYVTLTISNNANASTLTVTTNINLFNDFGNAFFTEGINGLCVQALNGNWTLGPITYSALEHPPLRWAIAGASVSSGYNAGLLSARFLSVCDSNLPNTVHYFGGNGSAPNTWFSVLNDISNLHVFELIVGSPNNEVVTLGETQTEIDYSNLVLNLKNITKVPRVRHFTSLPRSSNQPDMSIIKQWVINNYSNDGVANVFDSLADPVTHTNLYDALYRSDGHGPGDGIHPNALAHLSIGSNILSQLFGGFEDYHLNPPTPSSGPRK
jgi:hypothetical protein